MADPVKAEKVSVPRPPTRCQATAIKVAKSALETARQVSDVLVSIQKEFDIPDRMWAEKVQGKTLPPETPDEIATREAKEKADDEEAARQAKEDAKLK